VGSSSGSTVRCAPDQMGCQASHVRMTCELRAKEYPKPNMSSPVSFSMENDSSKVACEEQPIEEHNGEHDIHLYPPIHSPPDFADHYLHLVALQFFLHNMEDHAMTFENNVHWRRHKLDRCNENSSGGTAASLARNIHKGRCQLVPQHTSCACVKVSTSLMSL